jgi:hypothetical protein
MLLCGPVEIILWRDEIERLGIAIRAAHLSGGTQALTNRDEAIVLIEWQPTQDDRVHDREDGGRRADAKGQYDKGRARKAGG